MFELEYRIVLSADDDFEGQNGFFQIKCNNYSYGEMYPKEWEDTMDTVSQICYNQLKLEVVEKAREYTAYILANNKRTAIDKIKRLEEILQSSKLNM